MGIKLYDNGSCTVVIWEKRGGFVRVMKQLSIGIVDMCAASKESFYVNPGANIHGVAALPAVSPLHWVRHEVHNEGVVPTRVAQPQSYAHYWYTAPLARPVYEVHQGDIMIRAYHIGGGILVNDLVIDVGRIFYACFRTPV